MRNSSAKPSGTGPSPLDDIGWRTKLRSERPHPSSASTTSSESLGMAKCALCAFKALYAKASRTSRFGSSKIALSTTIKGQSKLSRKITPPSKESMPSFQDLTGQRFGKLTAIRRAENNASGRVQWLCQCECGNTPVVIASNLKRGKTGACFECWKAGNKNRLSKPHSWAHDQRRRRWDRRLRALAAWWANRKSTSHRPAAQRP
jgi:hypothetical protein